VPVEIDMGRVGCQHRVDNPIIIIQRGICGQVTASFAFQQMTYRAVGLPTNFGPNTSNRGWKLCNRLIPVHSDSLAQTR
jgi:hypothetical protein